MIGRLAIANCSPGKPLRGPERKSLYLGYVTSAAGGEEPLPSRLTVRRDPNKRQVQRGWGDALARGGDDALEKRLCQLCFASPWFTVTQRQTMGVCIKAYPSGGVLFNPTWGEHLLGGLLFLSQKKRRGFSAWTPTAVRRDRTGGGSVAERNPSWLYSS